MKKIVPIFGILSPIFYLAAVLTGGILWSEYSHIAQPISELTADFAPNMPVVDLLFFLANLTGLLFGLGLLFLFKKKSRILLTTSILLTLSGIVSLVFVFFPQDPIGADPTFKGVMHFVLAGLASLSTIAIVFTGAFAFSFLKRIKSVSFLFGSVVVISGFLTVFAIQNWPTIFGIFERVTIFSYMLWLFVVSYCLFRTKIN